ncbi:MAG: M14 family metallocarboxypeptidase [Akkermansiaceae bacterium]
MSFDVTSYLQDFSKAAKAAGFHSETLEEIGGYVIPAYTKKSVGAPRVYLSSGMHGDEPAGVLAMRELIRCGCFDDSIEWRLCPLINPTGLASGTRENAQGVDLNRDYLKKNTAEVSAHVSWLEKQPVPEMFISLHEDWESTGFYLYEIQKRGCPSTARKILKAAEAEIQTEPSALIDDHEVREPGWIFHEPRADYPDQWPEAIYMAEMGTRVSYTLETPSSLPLEKRVACHTLAVRTAVEGFLLTRGEAKGCNDAT